MAEQVQTGGVMQFRYSQKQSELDPDRKNAIEVGYAEADERKKKERKKKITLWIILILLVILIAFYYFLSK